jgi:hypothetical protein
LLLQDKLSELDSLRLELERAKENLNSKNYEIKYMQKGIELTDSIFKCFIFVTIKDKNARLQELLSKKNKELNMKEGGSEVLPSLNSSPTETISIGGGIL